MVKVTSVKKLMILLVALLVCATVVFAACTNGEFKPVSNPDSATPESNGGMAVKYGEWLYYVNGYTSDVSADNTYSDDVKDTPRIGSIVRIKIAELEKLFEISEDDSRTSKSDDIADYVREHAETVVPKIYISNNTSSKELTGIHIFGDRIYITTPNDALTAGGNPRTSELNLMSFKLNGSDPQKHFTFTSSSAEIWLTEKDGKVVATYYMDSQLHHLDVASGKDMLIELKIDKDVKEIENVHDLSSKLWDFAGKNVFFINSIGQLCKLAVGETEYTVVADNDTFKLHNDHIESGDLSYSIKSANDGEVYYTKNNDVESETRLYWTNGENGENVALDSYSTSAIGWRNGQVIKSFTEDSSYYGIQLTTSVDNSAKTTILEPEYNEDSISITKVEGDKLYYSADSVYYVIDIQEVVDGKHADEDDYLGEAYAYSPSTSGWADADFIDVEIDGVTVHYVFTAGTGSISVVKFNVETKKNSESSVNITLLPVVEEEDE